MSIDADVLAELVALRHETSKTLSALRDELAEVREKLTYQQEVFTGWKDIAAYLKLSEDHCKELGQASVMPIPHWYEGNRVVARRSELDLWLTYRRKFALRRTEREDETTRGKRQLGLFDAPKAPKRGRATDGSAS
jgi:hypothetical protein